MAVLIVTPWLAAIPGAVLSLAAVVAAVKAVWTPSTREAP